MNAEFTSRIRQSSEQAQAARQFAEQCRQRAAQLIMESSVLMQRFDELEYKTLLRAAARSGRKERKAGTLKAFGSLATKRGYRVPILAERA